MLESLNVIALISGGKDSFYSILHCIKNGHKIIALGNLYPPENSTNRLDVLDSDLNSYMYQTVGHTVIPHYERALGIPLYREAIIGTVLDSQMTYGDFDPTQHASSDAEDEFYDETECMMSLLRRIMIEHPSANALCSGAIFSTYQRTRIESVAYRLGLVPLSYLWHYPNLSSDLSVSLLKEMGHNGLDARIIKVGGSEFDESFLWQAITNETTISRMQRYMRRLGLEDKGTLLGEGGEYETLVLDGPSYLFKGRIEIRDIDRAVIREAGGSTWLKIKQAKVVMKTNEKLNEEVAEVQMPKLLEPRFREALDSLNSKETSTNFEYLSKAKNTSYSRVEPHIVGLKVPHIAPASSLTQLMLVAPTGLAIQQAAVNLKEQISLLLNKAGLESMDIIFTMVLLQSMEDFAYMNSVYSTLFLRPNPPARVTFSCGDSMPRGISLMILLTILQPSSSNFSLPSYLSTMKAQENQVLKKALHVQSRSYWVPANIGPYSQAIITTQTNGDHVESGAVRIAGQIPLIPHNMKLPPPELSLNSTPFQLALSLQHIWRIGINLKVGWWSSVIVYISHKHVINDIVPDDAIMASNVWTHLHEFKSGNRSSCSHDPLSKVETGYESNFELGTESDVPDLWEERYDATRRNHCGSTCTTGPTINQLPDWSLLSHESPLQPPPIFTIEVHELPRASRCEWHVQLGIPFSIGPRQIFIHGLFSPHYTIHLCIFGLQRQTIIAIPFTRDSLHLVSCLAQAEATLVAAEASSSAPWSHDNQIFTSPKLSYRDYSLIPTIKQNDAPHIPPLIPCFRIWNATGQRISHLDIYSTC